MEVIRSTFIWVVCSFFLMPPSLSRAEQDSFFSSNPTEDPLKEARDALGEKPDKPDKPKNAAPAPEPVRNPTQPFNPWYPPTGKAAPAPAAAGRSSRAVPNASGNHAPKGNHSITSNPRTREITTAKAKTQTGEVFQYPDKMPMTYRGLADLMNESKKFHQTQDEKDRPKWEKERHKPTNTSSPSYKKNLEKWKKDYAGRGPTERSHVAKFMGMNAFISGRSEQKVTETISTCYDTEGNQVTMQITFDPHGGSISMSNDQQGNEKRDAEKYPDGIIGGLGVAIVCENSGPKPVCCSHQPRSKIKIQ